MNMNVVIGLSAAVESAECEVQQKVVQRATGPYNRPMRPGPEKWSERFERFAEQECRGRSPLYETVSLELAGDGELLDWIASVIGPRAHPTLLFAAVHHLLLAGADGADLAAFFPNMTDVPAPPQRAYPAFRAFIQRERARLAPLLAARVTQTNEVARCCYLLPAFVLAAKRSRKPLWIIDVGASAGLNLLFDRYAYDYGVGRRAGAASSQVKLRTELRGNPVATTPAPTIAGRVGLDLEPIDLDDDAQTRWLEACTWPEHVDRFRNLRAALAIARREKPRVVKGNAIDALPALVDEADRDAAVTIVNTNVMLYFSTEERARYRRLLSELAAARELIWIANEHPSLLAGAGFTAPIEQTKEPSALPLVMSHFVDGRRDDRVLAVVGAHARWLDWFGVEGAA
jgi:hypothetical protein